MSKKSPIPGLLILLTAFYGLSAPHAAEASALAHILESSKAIVRIEADFAAVAPKQASQGLRVLQQRSEGAGIIVGEEGLIITSAHLVRNARRIRVTLRDREPYTAIPVYMADQHDLALLKIEPRQRLSVSTISTSEKPRLNSSVYTVGSSVWLQNTISEGRITGLGQPQTQAPAPFPRTVLLKISFDSYPGDSGSPVFDARGHLVGMTIAARTTGKRETFALSSGVILYFLEHYYSSAKS